MEAHEFFFAYNNFGCFGSLEGVGVLELLASGFLSNLPLDLLDTASGTTATDETDRRVSRLNFTTENAKKDKGRSECMIKEHVRKRFEEDDCVRDIKCLNLGSERLDSLEGSVILVDHDITNTGHVLLVKTLDVHTDVVTSDTLLNLLVVHFNGENFSGTGCGGGVGGEEEDILVGNDLT